MPRAPEIKAWSIINMNAILGSVHRMFVIRAGLDSGFGSGVHRLFHKAIWCVATGGLSIIYSLLLLGFT